MIGKLLTVNKNKFYDKVSDKILYLILALLITLSNFNNDSLFIY